ncbi:hypothetical protein AB0B04_18920 [Streptomyces xinghaiensis]|uniref:Uncharacterized protein n=2 Tax=Streptomyces TaxID=1883 RepID=A0A3M8EXE1_9ACTN|nr:MULTISPECIES: hypothetical protein [Streptomyces]KNE78789.1 hypothetical protein ADZ36_31250 [Streptomyces fradiae]OFA36648.1 hypothetical protein BEN35_29775 [Streptomyces fradiae]PQM20645.1 hypothetical protein Sfr7A_26020 [Streptomyces xinghaiensis]RKM92585.1 hypothetical protein SFRA_024675 [Streptomyces xinghaiensis]RNC70553.1 hypothetical protein DC095_025665 [Streptomyces xinghaiensis]
MAHTGPDHDRSFTFLAGASVLVTIQGATEQAARTTYKEITEEFAIGFTTQDGHHLDALTLEDTKPELYRVDGEEPAEECPDEECDGYLINGRCTDARHTPPAADHTATC